MSREEYLENILDQAIHTIEFLHNCLTQPDLYRYAYPGQTLIRIGEWREVVPERPTCFHSHMVPGCEGCEYKFVALPE